MSIYQDVLNAAKALNTVPVSYTTTGNYNSSGYTTLHGPEPLTNFNLTGPADLTMDGVSLREFMQTVTARLNMLVPNPIMEAEWAELKELGDAYRELEQRCLEKSRVWAILNKT